VAGRIAPAGEHGISGSSMGIEVGQITPKAPCLLQESVTMHPEPCPSLVLFPSLCVTLRKHSKRANQGFHPSPSEEREGRTPPLTKSRHTAEDKHAVQI